MSTGRVGRTGSGMTVLRALLVAAGVAAIGFGLWHWRDLELEKLVSTLVWLAGSVVAHDLVLAPVVVVLGVVAARLVPRRWRTPLAVGFVLWGTLTLVALPALSGMGERPDNPTLLDRPYATAWWAGTALVVLCVLAYGLLTRRRSDR